MGAKEFNVRRVIVAGNANKDMVLSNEEYYKGNVGACSYIPKFADNIKDKPLDEILKNNKLFIDLREYKNKLEGKCNKCTYKMICGGCRASALALKKSLFAEDPLCLAN